MPVSHQFQVRIPKELRHLYGGKVRLRERYEDPKKGRKWAADERAKIAALLAGDREAHESRRANVKDRIAISFGDAFDDYVATKKLAPRTRRWYRDHYRAHVQDAFEHRQLEDVSFAAITEHLAGRVRESSLSNVNIDLTILKMVVRWGIDNGWSVDPSALRAELPEELLRPEPKEWDEDAVEKMLAATSGRDRVALEIVAWTGMRGAELRAFERSWINWTSRAIMVPHDRRHRTKGKKARPIPMSRHLERVLKAWLKTHRDDRVIPPKTPGQVKPANEERGEYGRGTGIDVRKLVARACKAAGVELDGLHAMRHRFASWLSSAGFDLREIQAILGHASSRTTEGYIHVRRDFLATAAQRIDRATMDSRMDSQPRRRARG